MDNPTVMKGRITGFHGSVVGRPEKKGHILQDHGQPYGHEYLVQRGSIEDGLDGGSLNRDPDEEK